MSFPFVCHPQGCLFLLAEKKSRNIVCVLGATIRLAYPGAARKNFEINKFHLRTGENNVCTQAPCIYSVTENVKTIFSYHLDVK